MVLSQHSPSETIKVNIEGNVSSQVAIGNNILQIGEIHGGIWPWNFETAIESNGSLRMGL